MNYDVINAYVKSDFFNIYTTMYELSFFHYILCEDKNGDKFLLKSSVGEHFHQQINKELLDEKYCKLIENYIKRNYSASHLSLIIYAIISNVSEDKIDFLSKKSNEKYAFYILNAFLQGVSCEEIEALKKSVCSKDLIKSIISVTPPFTYSLENLKTHDITKVDAKEIVADSGIEIIINPGKEKITLGY